MKNFKKVLALVLAVVMLLSFATVASAADSTSYKDVDDIDYTEAVDVLSAIGILDGFPDKTFRPEANITRAQAAKIIAMFDNKATDINKIYASANPFTDCVGNWAESYIAYGYKTGIIDGVGNLKFAPNNNVTGTQFLKMALIVLGYDAKAEELTGKNWDVNTLALAKRVGLTAGFAKTKDFTVALTRQEAALIMLNALRADVVEYGSKYVLGSLKWDEADQVYYYDGKGSQPYITIAGAVSTGDKLMGDWNLSEGYTTDAFMRPYRTWKLGNATVGTYMFPVAAEFTTKYNACDLLVELGISTSNISSSAKVVAAWINGADAADYKMIGTLQHDTVAYHDNCDMVELVEGKQGTLTQVFSISEEIATKLYDDHDDGGYYVTEIDTFLAKVTKTTSKTTNKEGHIVKSTVATLEVYGGNCDRLDGEAATFDATTGSSLKAGDFVLVRLSENAKSNDAQQNVIYTVVEMATPETKTGSFDGLRMRDYPEETRIDGEFVPNAEHFHLGESIWANRNYGTKVFFFDTYGNVIGMSNPAAAAAQYLTINGMWVDHEKGSDVMYADVVTMDGKLTAAVTVASLDGEGAGHYADEKEDEERKFAWAEYYHELYTYTVNANGAYVINSLDLDSIDNVSFTKGETYVKYTDSGEVAFAVDNSTQFLIHEKDGSYKAVTGYKSLESMFVTKALYVDNDDDGYADIVYFCKPTRDGDTFYAYYDGMDREYVLTSNGVEYLGYVVYVNGVKTIVYQPTTDPSQLCGLNNGNWQGWVKLTYHNDGDIEYVTFVADINHNPDAMLTALNAQADITVVANGALTWGGAKYDFADDVKIYTVDEDRAVVEAVTDVEVADLAGTRAAIITSGGNIVEIYVYGGWNW